MCSLPQRINSTTQHHQKDNRSFLGGKQRARGENCWKGRKHIQTPPTKTNKGGNKTCNIGLVGSIININITIIIINIILLSNIILNKMGPSSSSTSQAPVDAKGKIEQLNSLLEASLISQAEFDTRKQQVLDQLVAGPSPAPVPGFYSLDTKDKLLTFIEKLRGEKRKNPFSGGKTFGSLPLLDRVWDREKEAMKVVEYLKEALSSDRKLESRGFSATMAARGCGKSLMVDYIQDLHDKKLPKNEAKENEAKENEAKDEEEYWLGELNARLIPIRISFNGEQQLDSEENDALNSPCSPSFSPKIACFLRMIHSGFFDTEAFAWGGFLSEVRKMGNLQDIEMVALHDSLCDFFASHVPQPIFFLAIDEVLRVGEGSGVEEGQIRGVLTAAKSLLDHDSTMWRLFVTTFDDHLVQDQPSLPSLSPSLSSSSSSSLSSLSPRDGGNGGEEKILHREYTGSSRPIVWIPLPPLRIPEEKWQRLTWMKSRRNSNGARELQYLLAVMGGHPRSLRFLYDEMEIHPEASCLDTLDGVWQRFRRWVTNYDDEVWQDLLERALRGDEINTDAAIGRSSLSVMTLLQRSVLLNDVEPDQPFTPHLSLLSLRHWCSTNQEGSHRVVKILLARLTELGMTLNWITFEIFISLFEQLRSWAFSQQLKKKKKSDNVTLFQYWKGAKLLKGSNPVLSFQAGSPKEQTPVLPLLSNCQEPIGNGHYLAAVGQPGFDAMIVKEKVVMFIESRFSENEATTTLCRDKDVYEKVSLLRKEISECPVNVGTAKLSDCRCVFVLVTHRKAPGGNLTKFIALVKEGPKNDDEKEKGEKEKKEKEKKKENYQSFAKFEGTILLMDKDCLETHLGLTFAQLGGFWLSLSSKNNCVNTSIKQEKSKKRKAGGELTSTPPSTKRRRGNGRGRGGRGRGGGGRGGR